MRISQSGTRDASTNSDSKRNIDQVNNIQRGLKEESKTIDEDEVDQKQVDGVLSQGLMSMSILDRNAILEEIHGATCLAVEETPELLQAALEEFEQELERGNGKTSDSKAYRLLVSQNEQRIRDSFGDCYKVHPRHPSYSYAIDDDNFRLRFLRCELFNVSKAVKRFYDYLSYVHEHWGEIALKRPIRLSDFTKNELKLFRKGMFQLLPYRDSSGRRVMVILGAMEAHQDIRARDKLYFYLWDVVTRDSIESQQKGFVIIRLHGDISREDTSPSVENSAAAPPTTSFRSVIKNLNRILSSIPSRLVAVHTRVPDHPGHQLVWKLFVTQVFTGENVSLRSRFVASFSSAMEMMYRLKSYGIPIKLLPLTENNSIKFANHNQWMKTRKLLEEEEINSHTNILDHFVTAPKSSKIIECPALNDVIFRQGSKVTSSENPGNRIFQDLLGTFLTEKERVTQQLKQAEKERVTQQLEQADAKFAHQPSDIIPDFIGTQSSEAIIPPAANTDSKQSIDGKKKTGKSFCDWLIDHIEQERKGRFLEWNSTVNGWVVMRDKAQISKKVSNTLYNWGKRIGKRSRHHTEPTFENNTTNGNDQSRKKDHFNAYRFIDGRRPPFEQEETCCIPSMFSSSVHDETSTSPSNDKKRPRIDHSFPP